MIEFYRPQQEKEKKFETSYSDQANGYLVFYRVTKMLGYPVEIEDNFDEDGEITESAVSMPRKTFDELKDIWNSFASKTRNGDAAWRATVGSPYSILETIRDNQIRTVKNDGEDALVYNTSALVPLQALQECFVTAYEHVDGYRPTHSESPDLDIPYQQMIEAGVKPITPEGMAILMHQAIQELVSQSK